MEWQSLNAEQRRYFVDIVEVYERYRGVEEAFAQHKGGLYWKKARGREYLFRARNRRGEGRSLGPRFPETEATYEAFHNRKAKLQSDRKSLRQEIARLARFAVAAGIARMPRTQADILRVLERRGWLGQGLRVGGSNAFYAYEAAAGVQIAGGMLETADLDLIFDHRQRLKFVGDPPETLLAALQSVDKSFELLGEGHFAAANARGFRVELIKPFPAPPLRDDPRAIDPARPDDLHAAEIDSLELLENAPAFTQTVIADNGYPVHIEVPDPRFFAAHKLEVSRDPGRSPVKARRDAAQAHLLAQLVAHYLPALPLDDPALQAMPMTLRQELQRLAEEPPKESLPPGL